MIVKGRTRKVDSNWLKHLSLADDNEKITVIDTRGLFSQDIRAALRELDDYAVGTKCQKPVFSVVLAPAIPATNEDFDHALALVEEQYPELKDQPRIIIEHMKNGIAHRHIEYARCSPDKAAINLPWTKAKLLLNVSLPMFERMGIQPPAGALEFAEKRGVDISQWTKSPPVKAANSVSTKVFKTLEKEGLDPVAVIEQLRACKDRPDLLAALAENSLLLAQGDKAPVIVTADGTVVQTAGRLLELKAKEVRERLGGIELPTVEDVKEKWKTRPAPERHPALEGEGRVSWENVIEVKAELDQLGVAGAIQWLDHQIKQDKKRLRHMVARPEMAIHREFKERMRRRAAGEWRIVTLQLESYTTEELYKQGQLLRDRRNRLRELRRQDRIAFLQPYIRVLKDVYRSMGRLAAAYIPNIGKPDPQPVTGRGSGAGGIRPIFPANLTEAARVAFSEKNLSHPPSPSSSFADKITADRARRFNRIRGQRRQLTGRDREDDPKPPTTPPKGPRFDF